MPDNNNKFNYETSPAISYGILRRNARSNRRYSTQAESILWQCLRGKALGYRFRRQHLIGEYIPDFVCLSKKLVVEIDGRYHFIGTQPLRDEERTHYLETQGFRVIRFTNEEVVANIDYVLSKIRETMNEEYPIYGNKKEALTPLGPPLLWRGRGRLIIFSAPSGTGKSTIINWLMAEHPELNLAFSISCTSRQPRGMEKDGVEYFFVSPEEFRRRIANDEFLEYEEVYRDRFYGTLKAQVDHQLEAGQNVVFDLDVKGGCNVKKFYGDRALSIFIQPPSVEELRRRLEGRATDAPEVIDDRIARASYELSFARKFDKIVINDDLEQAKRDTLALVEAFLNAEKDKS
ncbi:MULTISPECIES: guanylate kinase [Prevotellaceae]|uniref:guanylate kinase n=1 Tax=Prevotellaceae TaxID=171552 RepID=UPI0003D2B2EB|nr:guanylate kinase [Prevotella phocaeensis]ETD18328.1 guanylate kinase [Hoylesella oralis CC98A]